MRQTAIAPPHAKTPLLLAPPATAFYLLRATRLPILAPAARLVGANLLLT